jgi:flagellar biosynthesis protein FlhB
MGEDEDDWREVRDRLVAASRGFDDAAAATTAPTVLLSGTGSTRRTRMSIAGSAAVVSAAAAPTSNDLVLRLLLDAVRTLVEVTAQAVSMLLLCAFLANVAQNGIGLPVWPEDEEGGEPDGTDDTE